MYRMPAEWEPHEAVWMAWPYDKISFGSLNEPEGKFNLERLPKVEKIFAKIITELAKSERVELLIRDLSSPPPSIPPHQGEGKNIRLHQADYADVWTRDYAPSFVIDNGRGLKAVKWEYDAYSKKFPDLLKDNEVFSTIPPPLPSPPGGGNSKGKNEILKAGIIMEGGAIEVNGQGVLLTTEQCLLNRNPNLSKTEIEKVFAEFLGISMVIWLKEGIAGDHTDGHIDEVARFVSPNKVICAYEDNPRDENYYILNDAYQALKSEFEAVKVPMPHVTYCNGKKAPASYVNFFIANEAVLIPKFHDPNDDKAFEIIKSQFPDRKAVSIDCSEMIYGGGVIHCATREVPKL